MAISIFPSTAAEFVSNNFVVDMNDTTNNTVTLQNVKQAGTYNISLESGDGSFDIYLLDSDGALVAYTNTTTVAAPGLFQIVVILGVADSEIISFSYAGTVNNTDGEGNQPGAGAYLESVSPSNLPAIDDTATITGGNFGANTEITFESGATVLPAKNIVVNSSTEIIVTRPDSLTESEAPYTIRAVTTGVSEPTGTNSNILTDEITVTIASGGTITEEGGFIVHTFESTDTFELFTEITADVLVVAGGGGGGNAFSSGNAAGGGGGAGGVLQLNSQALSPGTFIATVGAGGAESANGSNSSLGAIGTAIAGGAGGNYNQNGSSGGSGGGGGAGDSGSFSGGSGTSGQGFAGGSGADPRGGGGGGAGEAGNTDGQTFGGDGVTVWAGIFGGGGGAGFQAGSGYNGGSGGGGSAEFPSEPPTANKGGGGAGDDTVGNTATGGASGIIKVRYAA